MNAATYANAAAQFNEILDAAGKLDLHLRLCAMEGGTAGVTLVVTGGNLAATYEADSEWADCFQRDLAAGCFE